MEFVPTRDYKDILPCTLFASLLLLISFRIRHCSVEAVAPRANYECPKDWEMQELSVVAGERAILWPIIDWFCYTNSWGNIIIKILLTSREPSCRWWPPLPPLPPPSAMIVSRKLDWFVERKPLLWKYDRRRPHSVSLNAIRYRCDITLYKIGLMVLQREKRTRRWNEVNLADKEMS